MFNKGTLEEKYSLCLHIRKKTRKVAKVFGYIYLVLIGLIVTIAVFASTEKKTVGSLVLVAVAFLVGYFTGYVLGSGLSWTYYWINIKFDNSLLDFFILFLAGNVGIVLWLKYRNYYKKLAREMKKQGLLQSQNCCIGQKIG